MSESPSVSVTTTTIDKISYSSEGASFVFIEASKGPVGVPTGIYSVGEYESIYGKPTTNRQLLDFAVVSNLLSSGGAISAIRIAETETIDLSSNHPDSPSPAQIVGINIGGDASVVEGKIGQITVELVFADGGTRDVSSEETTSYTLRDPNFGQVSNGVFFASDQLGTAIIDIQVPEGTFTASVEVVLLEVDRIELFGSRNITTGSPNDYRAIAYFVDGSARDVTFEDATIWTPTAGSYSTFEKGLLTGETVSIDSENAFTIEHKNVTEAFTVTVEPTAFILSDAGDDRLQLSITSITLTPVTVGNFYSHVCEWVIEEGTDAFLGTPTELETTFNMTVDASFYFTVTLYIDRGTVNEQSDTLYISRAGASVYMQGAGHQNWSQVLGAQGRTGRYNDLTDQYENYLDKLTVSAAPVNLATISTFKLYNSETSLVDVIWEYQGFDSRNTITTLVIERFTSGRWQIYAHKDVAAMDHASVPDGLYRLRLRYRDYLVGYGQLAIILSNEFTVNVAEDSKNALSTYKAGMSAPVLTSPEVSNLETQLSFLRLADLPAEGKDSVYNTSMSDFQDREPNISNMDVRLFSLITHPQEIVSEYNTFMRDASEGLVTNYVVNLLS